MALRRLREKEAVNYKELHCGKPIAFGKREIKAEVLSELFEVERIIAERTKSRKVIICLIYFRSGNRSISKEMNFNFKILKKVAKSIKINCIELFEKLDRQVCFYQF
jgi:hypothetical protein